MTETERYIEYENETEWLSGRKDHIGASEMGVICGVSHFKSIQDLWREKTGRKAQDDLSENALVKYGKRAEEHLRALFQLKHDGEYEIEYHQFRVYRHKKHGWLTCTLDGEIKRLSDGKKGVLEVKTKLVMSAADAREWENGIPQGYYCQVCEQLAVMEYDFAIVLSELRRSDGSAEIKEYLIEKEDIREDIDWVVEKAVWFHGYIERDKEPPIQITL